MIVVLSEGGLMELLLKLTYVRCSSPEYSFIQSIIIHSCFSQVIGSVYIINPDCHTLFQLPYIGWINIGESEVGSKSRRPPMVVMIRFCSFANRSVSALTPPRIPAPNASEAGRKYLFGT